MKTKKQLRVCCLYCNDMHSVAWKGQATNHLSALKQFKKENKFWDMAKNATLKNTIVEFYSPVVTLKRGKWVEIWQ